MSKVSADVAQQKTSREVRARFSALLAAVCAWRAEHADAARAGLDGPEQRRRFRARDLPDATALTTAAVTTAVTTTTLTSAISTSAVSSTALATSIASTALATT